MVIMDVVINCGARDTSVSRRKLRFDKRKLQDPQVVASLKHELGKILVPSRDIEQRSRAHIVNEAISEVLEAVAPLEQKVPRQHWVSDHTMIIIEYRNWLHHVGCTTLSDGQDVP